MKDRLPLFRQSPRNIRRYVATTVGVGLITVMGASCKQLPEVRPAKPSPTATTLGLNNVPTPLVGVLSEIRPVEQQTALQEIANIEKAIDQTESFDWRNKLAYAVAKYACGELSCKQTAFQLAQMTVFASGDEFLKAVAQDQGHTLSPDEKQQWEKDILIIKKIDHAIIINTSRIQTVASDIKQNNATVAQQLTSYNADRVVTTSVLFYAFALTQATAQESTISYPFTVEIPGQQINMSISEMRGFQFIGKTKNGEAITLNGASLAATAYVAGEIGKETGTYLILSQASYDSALLIAYINEKTGITPTQFYKYFIGELPMEELLKKWGSRINPANPDEQAARNALLHIGLVYDKIISADDGKQQLDVILELQ